MATARSEVDRLLDREALKAERWRALVISGVVVVTACIANADILFGRGDVERTTRHSGLWIIEVAFAITFAIELRVFFRAKERLATDTAAPLAGRMSQAAAEALLPTLLLTALLLGGGNPEIALGFPPSYLYFVFVLLSVARLEPWICATTGAVGAAGFTVLVLIYAPREDLLFQLARPTLVAVSGGIAAAIARTLRDYVHRVQRVTTTFGQYVSPAVAQKLLEQRGELPSEVRHVCVMFLDIRNFTTFAERRGPDEVVRFLNEVFAFMIDVVNAHHGVINKFLGDGFMAVFGAPQSEGSDCENAIAAARTLIAELEKRVADGRLPATRIGIGLHAGPAVTGNVGSLTRREYTVIGDVVNLASRVESLNKEMGSMLLVTGEVVAALKTPPSPMTSKGPVKVKGREAPVEVFQLA